MKAPDKIYVAESRKIIGDIEHNVFSEQPFLQGSIEYIRKDLLLDYLKKEFSIVDFHLKAKDDAVWWGQRNAFQQVIDKINSL